MPRGHYKLLLGKHKETQTAPQECSVKEQPILPKEGKWKGEAYQGKMVFIMEVGKGRQCKGLQVRRKAVECHRLSRTWTQELRTHNSCDTGTGATEDRPSWSQSQEVKGPKGSTIHCQSVSNWQIPGQQEAPLSNCVPAAGEPIGSDGPFQAHRVWPD